MGRLDRIVHLRQGEGITAGLMFAYSFLAMTAYNVLKPITRSEFIEQLRADNLPYVQLGAGVLIAVLMHFYTQAMLRLPRRWVIPITQTMLAAILLAFWPVFDENRAWVSVAFYVYGLMLGLLLISQFWTLANDIYNPRQARRLFGFIGAGASLGGATGAAITRFTVEHVGLSNLLPVSAGILMICVGAAVLVIARQPPSSAFTVATEEGGVGAAEAIRLLRESRHLQLIAMVIGFAAIGAVFVEQQLNMAAADRDDNSSEGIAKFLAEITVYVSLFGFALQVGLTSRIHRSLGLIFALLLLPVTLGSTAVVILASGLRWAPGAARVLDSSLRYTIDKTTREVLFLPLPSDLKYRAKPFIDVTMDRFAKAVGAIALLVLIKVLDLSWQQISYASLVVMVGWIWSAMAARREYLDSFQRSLALREIKTDDVRFPVFVDPATLNVLVDYLSRPDDGSVLYAIDMLETLGHRERISPHLLEHRSPRVRARTLNALAESTEQMAAWYPMAERLLADPDADVRVAAMNAILAVASAAEGHDLLRRLHQDRDPRVVISAAAQLADSGRQKDIVEAEQTLSRFATDTRQSNAGARRDVAAVLARIQNPAFRSMLIPLIHDDDVEVAREAIASARLIGAADALFVPALVSMLGHRELKREAREALAGYGEPILGALNHFLHDLHEPIWVRRHLPATIARMPAQAAMDVLVGALSDPDGFLRYKSIEAIETLRRSRPSLTLPAEAIEPRIVKETAAYYSYLTLRYNLVSAGHTAPRSLLVRALDEKLERALDRIYRLLGLLHSIAEVQAAREAIESGDVNTRAHGLEYLDNLLQGAVRKRVMPIVEDLPITDKIAYANSVLHSRPRDVPDTIAQLVHEHDPVVAATAVHFAVQSHVPALDDDFDYLLSHRATDPIVREAAEWARRRRAPDASAEVALPIVELASRLRFVSVFGRVSVDELFRIAQAARQAAHPHGHHLSRAGAMPEEVLILVDGYGRLTGDARHAATVAPPAVLNIGELLEKRPLRYGLDAETDVVVLTLPDSTFLTMLADNMASAQGLFRMLIGKRSERLDWSEATPAPTVRDDGTPLDAVEKTLHLRQIPLFTQASVIQLQQLTAVVREVAIQRGDVLFGDAGAPAIYHLLSGTVAIERADGTTVAHGPGATIGAAETLTNAPAGRRARVVDAGRALRLTHDDLFDVLGDHGELLQDVFGVVLSTIETDLTY